MPIPVVVLIVAASVAAAGGAGAGAKGIYDTKKASDVMKSANRQNDANLLFFDKSSKRTQAMLEELGELEIYIAKDFGRFTEAFAKIKNKPEFSARKSGAGIPHFDFSEIRAASVGARAFLGAVASGAAGVIFSAAASAGMMSAMMALGTASTGTAIASLSGAAATKAALAAFGGGAIAAGGGGVALGTIMLGAASAGLGILFGGAIFAVSGSRLRKKAGEAYHAMQKNEREINRCVEYFEHIRISARSLYCAIEKVRLVYDKHVAKLIQLAERNNQWDTYNEDERLIVENNILIVSVLNKLINTPLFKSAGQSEQTEPQLDAVGVESSINDSLTVLIENELL